MPRKKKTLRERNEKPKPDPTTASDEEFEWERREAEATDGKLKRKRDRTHIDPESPAFADRFLMPAGRHCAAPGCITILSRYNGRDLCDVHAKKKILGPPDAPKLLLPERKPDFNCKKKKKPAGGKKKDLYETLNMAPPDEESEN
jgi:hypothetical protein